MPQVLEYKLDLLPLTIISKFFPKPLLILSNSIGTVGSLRGKSILIISALHLELIAASQISFEDKSVPRYTGFNPVETARQALTRQPNSAFCPLGVATKTKGLFYICRK